MLLLNLLIASAHAGQNVDGRLPVLQSSEPYLLLLRDPIVQSELKLTPTQLQELTAWTDETDGPLWTIRNQSAESATQIVQELIQRSREKMATLLDAQQRERLGQIELWVLGLRSLQRKEVISQLELTANQQKQIQDILEKSQKESQALQQKVQNAEPLAPLEKRNNELAQKTQKNVKAVLKPEQLHAWGKLMGEPLPADKLGYVRFKAPELLGEGPWVNSQPLKLADLRGKVVIVHFWTFGCSNCIHNYPAYQHWLEEFAGKDVVLLGIHTPELENEHNVATIRQQAAKHGLDYPTIVDNNSLNWNAWGNSMWPTVYLVDKSGYVRAWWQGELNWQGQEGEKLFKNRIEELLKEETVEENKRNQKSIGTLP